MPSVRIRAWDVGGGCRFGPLYRQYVEKCNGLIFTLRPTDDRLWSALWELYWIVQQAIAQDPAAAAGLAVCIVVPMNECDSDYGLFRPRCESSSTEGEDAAFHLPTLTRMAERESLPPGGTHRWSRARRWSGGEALESEEGLVDSQWLPAWEADRAFVTDKGRTQSHGMPVQHESSPPLAQLHTGPWVVLPVDMHARAADAMLPFKWIAANCASS